MNLTDVKLEIKHQRLKTKIKQEVPELGSKNVVLKGQEKHLGSKQTKQKDTKKTKKQTEDI